MDNTATIAQAIYDYFNRSCPLLQGGRVGWDYLPADAGGYTIEMTPVATVIKEYVDGGSLRQCEFVIAGREDYGRDVLQNLDNSGFYEKLADWLEQQTAAGNLPVLPDRLTAQSLESLSSAYILQEGTDNARYQIQCRLVYTRPAVF